MEQSVSFDNYAGDDSNKPVTFEADGRTMAIDISLSFKPTTDGGEIKVNCGYKNRTPIIFDSPKFPMKERGYVLEKMDSVKVNDSTYYDILVFDASKADTNNCNMEKFYYAAKDGIVKIIAKNKMELTRISEKDYEEIEKKNIAVADSINKALADSLAKADSMMQAMQDSLEKEKKDSIARDFIETIIEDAADCTKNLGIGATLSDLKKCFE